MQGFIKDYRKELDSDIWDMPPLYHRLWQYLKYKANHAENTIPLTDGRELTLQPGQHMTSLRTLAKGIGWHEGLKWMQPNPKTIKVIIDWMVKNNMVKVLLPVTPETAKTPLMGNRQYTLITLTAWALYQSKKIEGNTSETLLPVTPTTNKNDLVKNDLRNNEKNNALFSDGKAGATVQERKPRNNITVLHEIDYYKKAYERAYGKEHPHLKLEQYIRAYDAIEDQCVEEEGWEAMLDYHFHDSALETDGNIMHFITGEIMQHAFHKAGLYC